MVLLINIFQAIERQVGVNLRRRDIRVTQNSLHSAQICTVFHHVRGATVAQHVRAGFTP